MLGHNDFIYWHPIVLKHYLAGIRYALGDLPADATPNGPVTSKTKALLNKRDLAGWKVKKQSGSHWQAARVQVDDQSPDKFAIEDGADQLVNVQGHGVDIMTESQFGDCVLYLEVMVPKGSNSGIYLHGNYEIQVLDSYGKKVAAPSDIGGCGSQNERCTKTG